MSRLNIRVNMMKPGKRSEKDTKSLEQILEEHAEGRFSEPPEDLRKEEEHTADLY